MTRSPLREDQLQTGMTVFDLVYTPPVTPLIEAARKAGCTTITGTEMFIGQAQRTVLPVLRHRCARREDPGAAPMNTFGRNFRVTTFGESHGTALGAVIDGCPPGIPLDETDIQPLLDRRRPGTSSLTSPRREADRVEILSGVFEGKTTGTPIAMIVRNQDMQPGDYDDAPGRSSGPATRTSRTRRSTASATTGAAAGVPDGRRSDGLLPAPLP